MAVTMGQIAKKAGVSQATVSRVLSGRSVGFISDATRQRVREAAREMGFALRDELGPAAAARHDASRGRSGVVSIWVGWPMDDWTCRVVSALVEGAWRDGYEGLIRPILPDEEGSRRTAFAWPVDGLVVLGAGGVGAVDGHRASARPGRKSRPPHQQGASRLIVRGRAVPVVVVGIEQGCDGVECPAELDAIRCNPDGRLALGECPPEAVAAATWARLRARMVGTPGDADEEGSAAADRGVHVWITDGEAPEEREQAALGRDGKSIRVFPIVERETRLQSADAQLI